jgi:hypothetical protein
MIPGLMNMTKAEALVTAARTYLQENFSYWRKRYAHERTGQFYPYNYTDNDYHLFPRYNILSAILDQVKLLVGKQDLDFNSCLRQLEGMGLTANSVLTTGDQNGIACNAMQEERMKFVSFINSLDDAALALVKPLPYERKLADSESGQIRKTLFEKWNFQGNYWEPLEELSPEPTTFLHKKNITDEDYIRIIAEIQKNTHGQLYQVNEDGSDVEIEFALFHPDCYETIYCDDGYNWIVYGSHEGTVAFGGSWLLDFIRKLYAGREEQLNNWD